MLPSLPLVSKPGAYRQARVVLLRHYRMCHHMNVLKSQLCVVIHFLCVASLPRARVQGKEANRSLLTFAHCNCIGALPPVFVPSKVQR